MPFTPELATSADADAIATLRNEVAAHLSARFGRGGWSGHATARGVLFDLRHSSIYLARDARQIPATLLLTTRKPWAIDRSYFMPAAHP